MLRQHTKQHFKRGLSGIMAAVMTATLIPSLSVLADDEIKTVNYSFLSNTFKVSGTTVNINGDIDSNSDLILRKYCFCSRQLLLYGKYQQLLR